MFDVVSTPLPKAQPCHSVIWDHCPSPPAPAYCHYIIPVYYATNCSLATNEWMWFLASSHCPHAPWKSTQTNGSITRFLYFFHLITLLRLACLTGGNIQENIFLLLKMLLWENCSRLSDLSVMKPLENSMCFLFWNGTYLFAHFVKQTIWNGLLLLIISLILGVFMVMFSSWLLYIYQQAED